MNKKTLPFRKILFYAGVLLVIASAVFFAVYLVDSESVSVDTEKVTAHIRRILPTPTAGIKEERAIIEMPSVSFDGQDYVALLEIPRFSVELPVRSLWDKKAVRKVPCRFTGSLYDGTLIIGGTDSDGQFDFVSLVDIGDTLTVTDMNGCVFSFTVTTVKHAKNSKASTLIDDRYDLTLFAKDKKSGDWLLIRCNMK